MNWKVTTAPTVEPISLVEAKLHLRVETSADDELIKGLISAARDFCEQYEGRAYCVQTITYKRYDFRSVMLLPRPPLISISSVKYIDTNGDTQTLSASIYDVYASREPGAVVLGYNQTWPSVRAVPDAVEIVYRAGHMTGFTANATTNALTVGQAIFSDGDIVRLSTDQGDLPAPLAVDTDYYVRDVSGNTLTLATTSGGTAIDITDTGTGTHLIGASVIPSRVKSAMKLLIGHWYEHRMAAGEQAYSETPLAVYHLLSERTWL